MHLYALENEEEDTLPSSKKTPVLRPPTNSAQSIANNPDKPNLYRRKTVIGSYREKDIDSQDKAKNVPVQSLDLFPNRTDQPDQNKNSKVKKKPTQSRNQIWESSISKRPGSASKSFVAKSVRNSNRPISAGLLTYSKLIEIESNIQNENKNQTLNNEPDENEKWNENGKNEFLSFKTDWLNLPDEIWLRVLRFLKQNDLAKFGQTCKTFNYLYKDNSLWPKIELKYEYNVKDEWLDWIGKRRPNELNIVQCSGHVSLNGITGMFKNIGQNLQKLNLSRCSSGSLSGDNFALQASIRCPNVTSLDLSWTLLSNQTLKLIVDSFKKIESINLSGCNMIQEDGFNELLIKHGNSLKNLEIAGCIHFSSDVIFNIGCYCRGIEKLNISNCHRIKNESIIEACPQWLKLKYIDLRGIKNFNSGLSSFRKNNTDIPRKLNQEIIIIQ
ncbi:leucine rich repeats containing F box [Brachionus plicatilis]|uniref:Leucine rich repeats containing F box n=1 Tax=Brachionus plicatilis TaxID=10195 RepID=A0A3M7SNS3_BRAPC|nr:leucine rich repeats containing F box [Brachionus plicatilis]